MGRLAIVTLVLLVLLLFIHQDELVLLSRRKRISRRTHRASIGRSLDSFLGVEDGG
jgi:hypothetical protein